MSGFEQEDWVHVQAAIRATSVDKSQEVLWVCAVEEGIWNALVALFLCITPNLKEIELRNCPHYFQLEDLPLLNFVLERAAALQDKVELPATLFSLSSLTSVYFDYSERDYCGLGNGGMTFRQLEPFLKLKSVAKLEASHIIEAKSRRLPPVLCTKDLTLKDGAMGHKCMAYMFQAFKSLERLHYEQDPGVRLPAVFEPPRVMAALASLKHSLKDLTIITIPQGAPGYKYEKHPIGSFVDFAELTSIDVTSYILMGDYPQPYHDETYRFPSYHRLIDVLPSTLQYHSLRDIHPHHVQDILNLITQKAVVTPQLETLNLQWEGVTYLDKASPKKPMFHQDFTASQASELAALCEAANVKIVIACHPLGTKYVSYPRILTEDEKSKVLDSIPQHLLVADTKSFRYPYKRLEEFCRVLTEDEASTRPEGVNRPFVVTDTNVFQFPFKGRQRFQNEYLFQDFGGYLTKNGYTLGTVGFWSAS